MLGGTELRHMKRARLNAITASDASISEMLHNAIRSSQQSACRARRNTCRIIAMKAGSRNKLFVAVREFPGEVILNAAQLHTRRRIILQLAGDPARAAANAFF
jgi:hypothetical protein